MMASLLRLDLRRSRTLVVWVGLVAVAYSGTMALFYPIIRENTELLAQYLDLFPEGFLVAFGMTGSLADPGVFFGTYIGTWLWPILAAVVGALAATRPVAADLENGFLELVISTPTSRRRYLVASILGQAIVIVVLALATISAVLVLGAIVGAGFDPGRFLLVVPLATALGWAIAAAATLLSVITLSRGMAAGITAGVLLLMYLGNIVGGIEPDLGWLSSISVFGHFDTAAVIDTGVVPWADLALFAVVAVGCWLAALVAFGRRDLAA